MAGCSFLERGECVVATSGRIAVLPNVRSGANGADEEIDKA